MKKHFKLLIIFCMTAVISFGQTFTTPEGNGTSTEPYQISSLENLYWLSLADTAWDKYYIQTADIDASSSSTWNSGAGWSPIGNASTIFTGSYNGQGYTVSGLYMSYSLTGNIGLFGYTQNAALSGIGIINSLITVSDCNNVGGLAGYDYESNISQCFFEGTISNDDFDSQYLGGLIGYTKNSTIQQCYSDCSTEADSYNGNLIGRAYNCTISNCYTRGEVSGEFRTGGLIGEAEWGTKVTNCYSDVKLTADGTSDNGLLIATLWAATCENSFWNTSHSPSYKGIPELNSSDNDINNTGLTSEELINYSTFVSAGWELMDETTNGSENYWGFNPNKNDGTPFLSFQGYTNNPAPIIDSISDITASSATANFSIPVVASEINHYGICWNITGSPTVTDNHTDEGTVTTSGIYTSSLTGLEANNTYFVRAYTINATDTAYSPVLSFESYYLPETSTLSINNITDSLATGDFNISDLGVPNPSACGLCWNTTGTPTISDNFTDFGAISDTGTYTVDITSLTYNTTYYVRAYVTNEFGTAYGNELSFVAQNAVLLPSADSLFFNTFIGEVSSDSFYVKNMGEAALVIDSIIIENPLLSINNSAATINAGDSLGFIITYLSDTTISDTSTIIIYSNAVTDTVYTILNTSFKKVSDAGNAISFDGSNDYINLGSPDVFDNLAMGNFSIDMWIKTSDQSTRSILFGNYGYNPSINLEIHTDNGGGVLRTYLSGTSYMDDQSIADGKWHHIATVVDFDNDSVKIYIDGIKSLSGTGLPDKYTVSNTFYLGKDARSSSLYYGGQMDEVRIWNKALTQAEIRSQYGSLAGNEDGLIAYYRFDEESGNSIYDATGNGYTGTINGASRINPSTAPVADPVLTTIPEGLSFGSLFYSEKDTIDFKITNSGGGILHIDSLTFDTANFKFTPESENIFSGDSTEFQAIFAPDTTGDFSGYIVYNHNMGTDSTACEAYCVSLPHFTIYGLDNITGNSALINLHVDTLGVPNPNQYGLCWNTTGSPSLVDAFSGEGALSDTGVYNLEISELNPVTQYYVKAYFVNGTIVTYSNELSFTTTKITPVLTWATPSDITYGTALSETQLNAVADIAGTFTYSPASGTMLDAGESQELKAVFTPTYTDSVFVDSAKVSINVATAALTATAGDASRTYGEDNPAFTVSYTGFVNDEDATVLDTEPTSASEATATSDAGTYEIVASGGEDGNYDFTYQAGTLTVNKAALSIGVEDETVEKGSAVPDFTITYSGFVNSDDESVLDTPPSATCEATTESEAGTYDIVVSGGSDNNYELSYTNGILTITTLSGFEYVNFANISIFPNPVSDFVNINFGETFGPISYKLVSVTGEELTAEIVEDGSVTINMSQFKSGVYFLKFFQDNKEAYFKIVKE